MTSNGYQVVYLEALLELQVRGKIVGDPYNTPDGVRHVLVDGFPCVDELVLEQAWGKKTSDGIRRSSIEN